MKYPHLDLNPQTEAILEEYGFDQIPFADLQANLASNGFDPLSVQTNKSIAHPTEDAMMVYPTDEEARRAEYAALGQKAIEAGEVAVVILNGGMATRFGGVPKGAVPVVNGRSFLDLKLSQVNIAGAGKTPAILMNSFATQKATEDHLATLSLDMEVQSFCQFVSLRMTESGDVFKDSEGKPSLYAPGHGDFPYALQTSGQLEKLMSGGVRYITLSNVDNLGASLDPVIIGMHIAANTPMSVELVKAYKGDVGGFPAIVDGNLVIMEAFRLPTDFNLDSISVFNTNTFVFNADALKTAPVLDWFTVKKSVSGTSAIQCERLVGQMTEFVDVSFFVVPREGSESRFLPIKAVQDIEDMQEALVTRLKALEVM